MKIFLKASWHPPFVFYIKKKKILAPTRNEDYRRKRETLKANGIYI